MQDLVAPEIKNPGLNLANFQLYNYLYKSEDNALIDTENLVKEIHKYSKSPFEENFYKNFNEKRAKNVTPDGYFCSNRNIEGEFAKSLKHTHKEFIDMKFSVL